MLLFNIFSGTVPRIYIPLLFLCYSSAGCSGSGAGSAGASATGSAGASVAGSAGASVAGSAGASVTGSAGVSGVSAGASGFSAGASVPCSSGCYSASAEFLSTLAFTGR